MKNPIQNCLIAALLFLAAASGLSAFAAPREERLFVVATIPDLADMAKQIGKDRVEVESIAKGGEDLHLIPMKPSLLLLLNRADVLIEVGLDSEHAWLPDLLYNCRNDRIQPGEPGFINASARIKPLDRVEDPSRLEGEIHPEGNPHYNVDPGNGPKMAMTLCDGLCRACPEHADLFRAHLKEYLDLLAKKWEEWEALARPLRGVKVVTYHRSWSYLVERFGMEVVGEIEPKPGIAPSAGHLARLIGKMKSEGADLIIKEPYFSDRFPQMLSEKTGVPYVTLPNMCGAAPGTETHVGLMEHNIRTLLEALGKGTTAAGGEEGKP